LGIGQNANSDAKKRQQIGVLSSYLFRSLGWLKRNLWRGLLWKTWPHHPEAKLSETYLAHSRTYRTAIAADKMLGVF